MINGTEIVDQGEYDSEVTATHYEAGIVTFAVEETFKGKLGTEARIPVKNRGGSGACRGPFGFVPGEYYLVYADGNSNNLSITLSGCSRPLKVAQAADDIHFLRNLPKEGTGGRLYGEVRLSKQEGVSTPLKGVIVKVCTTKRKCIKAITNAKGQFEFTGLKPGKYHAKVICPKPYIIENMSEQYVSMSDRGCIEIDFWARNSRP
jgi:hypothetical protein